MSRWNRVSNSDTARALYNVIDTRQSYLQDVVVARLRGLGYNQQADRSVHFNYEMVVLSPRCWADLGIPLSERYLWTLTVWRSWHQSGKTPLQS
jgi:hypothetical protein